MSVFIDSKGKLFLSAASRCEGWTRRTGFVHSVPLGDDFEASFVRPQVNQHTSICNINPARNAALSRQMI